MTYSEASADWTPRKQQEEVAANLALASRLINDSCEIEDLHQAEELLEDALRGTRDLLGIPWESQKGFLGNI